MDLEGQRRLPTDGRFGAGQAQAEEDKFREAIKEMESGKVLGASGGVILQVWGSN